MGLDTKTYWLTDRQSQCNFDFASGELRAEDSSGGYSQGEWIQTPTVEYRTEKQKLKNQPDREDSENNEG
jgi:hypothetical protein